MFAVHPVSGVPVNYICIRDLLLAEVFLLASLLAYVRLRRLGGTPGRWAAAVALLALSLLSKEIGVVAPLLALAYEFTLGAESPARLRPWLRALPFAAVAAAFFAWTRLGLGFSDLANAVGPMNGTAVRYALTQARLHLFHYLRNFAWPFWMRPAPRIEPSTSVFDPAVLAGLLLIGASLAAAWHWRRRAPLASFAVLAYWISMAVESSVLPLFLWASDYRAFPAGAFLFLLAALALERFLRRPGRELAAGALILYFAVASVLMNRVWRTDETLWTHSVAHGGDALAHLNLAMSLKDRRDPRVRAHLEEAVRLQPAFVLANLNLGLLRIGEGRAAEGIALCERARDLEPGWAQTWHWLAQAYGRVGRRADAAAASRRAAELDPRNMTYLRQAAFDAQAAGDHAGCLALVRRLEERAVVDAELLFLQGFSRQQTGDLAGAEAAYRACLRLDPARAQVAFNLAYALMEQGRFQEAAGWFRRVLELKTDYHEVHYHLSRCYERLGNPAGAIREMELYHAATAPPAARM
jgi:tetratricopeptide (TPR) repeat protein